METNIFFWIVITYLALVIAPRIWRLTTLYKIFGYRRIFIARVPFTIRKISPLDFVEEKSGLPITFFKYAKGLTLWEQMQAEGQTEDKLSEKEMLERLEVAKLICSKAVVHWPQRLTPDDFFNIKMTSEVAKISWKLYAEVIAYNLVFLNKCFSLEKSYVIHVAELCAKFGKKPHEHLKPSGKLSDIEAYMIDEFFYSTLLAHENSRIEKQNREALKKRRR